MSGLPQDFLAYSIESKIFLRNDFHLITSLSSKFLVSDQIRHKCIGSRYIRKNHIDGVLFCSVDFFCTISISDLFPENTVVTITMLSTSQMSSLMRNRKFVMLITVRLRVYKSSWVLDLCLIIFMHHSSETISKLILEVWSRPLIPLKHKNV